MNKSLYSKTVATRDKIRERIGLLTEHLQELETIISLLDKKKFNVNPKIVNVIVQDAVDDANKSLKLK